MNTKQTPKKSVSGKKLNRFIEYFFLRVAAKLFKMSEQEIRDHITFTDSMPENQQRQYLFDWAFDNHLSGYGVQAGA